jgi:hypothetical protein
MEEEEFNPRLYEGRPLVIGTKHGKESVISPLVDSSLGVISFPSRGFDTDTLGTFTGEKERVGDPVTTLRSKCLAAMELHGCTLGIASEGSFGPHPLIPFVPADEELLILIDRESGIEVIHREICTDTNFSGAQVADLEGLTLFAHKALFPSHALILRESKDGTGCIVKAINDADALKRHFEDILTNHGSAYVETDMRAMHNPTRMKVIERGTRGLLEKVLSLCPACCTPGFTVKETVAGLPCSLCRTPTRSILALVHACQRCGLEERRGRPDGKSEEDPMFCEYCNP